MNPLCIYHHNCADGFGAAWAVRHAFGAGKIDFYPGRHGDAPPLDLAAGRDVILVDFSYKRTELLSLAERATSLLVLDHHKSAQEELTGFREARDLDHFNSRHPFDAVDWPEGRVWVHFDMDRSGAGIAWDFFHANEQPRHRRTRPELINHLEDRDLWRFLLPDTREIQAAVFSYPYDFEVWDRLMAMPVAQLATEGRAIDRKHLKDIQELIAACTQRMIIAGHDVPVINLPYTLASDAGNILAAGEPFAACYYDTADGRVFSLRSTSAGVDVSGIAQQFGGGGHRNAAGFRMPRGHVFEGSAA